jgi:hypothetical protein
MIEETHMTEGMEADAIRRGRGMELQAQLAAQKDRLYKGQHYTIVREIHLTDGSKFKTPFGHLGVKGYVLVNDNPEIANDPEAGDMAKHIVGRTLLEQIAGTYSAVELPAKRRPGRPATRSVIRDQEHSAAAAATAQILGALADQL